MRTRGTSNQAQFDFQTPLTIPQGYVCLVNVEGFFGTVPSLFSGDYINSSLNVFKRDNTDLWVIDATKDVYIRASTERMTIPSNQTSFFINFLESLQDPDVFITLPRLGFMDEVLGDLGLSVDSTQPEGSMFTITG